MNIKKLSVLLLSASLLGGFLTGCGKSDEKEAKEAITEAAEKVEEAAH